MRVLVVDDSRAMRSILRRMLEELGFEVAEASDGDGALQSLRDSASPDLILLDWNMPRMNGYATLIAMRALDHCRRVPILMVTTEVERQQMELSLSAGANEYVMKPFSKEVIVAKLQLLGLREAA